MLHRGDELSLRRLNLNSNRLGVRGVQALVSALRSGAAPRLEELHACDGGEPEKAHEALQEAYRWLGARRHFSQAGSALKPQLDV